MNDNAMLRLASAEELGIFYEWMKEQFHEGELKPLSLLYRLREAGLYCAYGLWDGSELIAYALLANTDGGHGYLLDYYAVLPNHQDAGWGSRFLQMLRHALEGEVLLLEVEDPACMRDPAEREICERRIRFYERNDCRHTPVKLNLFGFDYVIMTLSLAEGAAQVPVRPSLEEIYHRFFPEEAYARYVIFREAPAN